MGKSVGTRGKARSVTRDSPGLAKAAWWASPLYAALDGLVTGEG